MERWVSFCECFCRDITLWSISLACFLFWQSFSHASSANWFILRYHLKLNSLAITWLHLYWTKESYSLSIWTLLFNKMVQIWIKRMINFLQILDPLILFECFWYHSSHLFLALLQHLYFLSNKMIENIIEIRMYLLLLYSSMSIWSKSALSSNFKKL